MQISSLSGYAVGLPRFVKRGIVIFLDVLICIFSVWFSFGLRLDQWGWIDSNQWWVIFFSISFSIPFFIYFGTYKIIFRYLDSFAIKEMALAFFCYTTLFICLISVIGINGIPRSIGVIQPILFLVIIGISRYVISLLLVGVNTKNQVYLGQRTNVLIYGAGSAGRQLAAGLARNKDMLVKGFIDDDLSLQGNSINSIPVFSSFDLKKLILRFEVTDVLLAIPSVNQIRRNNIISSIYGCGVRVRSVPGLTDLALGRVQMSELHDLKMNDLLSRKEVQLDNSLFELNICNKVVLVTGAGGSIGSELCRQIIELKPDTLIMVDNSESALYQINEEIKKLSSNINIKKAKVDVVNSEIESIHENIKIKIFPRLASVCNLLLVQRIFSTYKPDIVFHAAAYKHVPLVEDNYTEGIFNNVIGTLNCAQVSLDTGVSRFVLISTDKAVRPTNIMGASKRISELIVQAIADKSSKEGHKSIFSMVRFGNVLGSSGSVGPLFRSQISSGGPITLTHPDVTRYFMTIPEAVQLVIQSNSMAIGGDVFVLDMGDPIRIIDLAKKMVFLSGLLIKDDLNPHGDIEIKVIGLRPGEKLYEELLIGNNPQPTRHPKIMKAHEEFLMWDQLKPELERLVEVLEVDDEVSIKYILKKLVPGYKSHSNV